MNETLAGYSNLPLYSSMAVYAGGVRRVRDRPGRERPAGDRGRRGPGQGAAALVASGPDSGWRPARVRPRRSPASGRRRRRPARRRRAVGIAMSLTWLAFLLHAGAVAAARAGREPAAVGQHVRVRDRRGGRGHHRLPGGLPTRDLRFLGLFITGPVLLTLGLAVSVLYTQAGQLVPALKSYWLAIHVSIAFISSALLVLAFSATVLYLVQSSRETRRAAGAEVGGNFMDALPPARELDQAAYRLHAVAFPLWTFTIVAGAIWAESAWGHYWGWDPKEVWSFVIWVIYAGYLHARATPRLGPAQGGRTSPASGSPRCCSTSWWSTSASSACTPTRGCDPMTAMRYTLLRMMVFFGTLCLLYLLHLRGLLAGRRVAAGLDGHLVLRAPPAA